MPGKMQLHIESCPSILSDVNSQSKLSIPLSLLCCRNTGSETWVYLDDYFLDQIWESELLWNYHHWCIADHWPSLGNTWRGPRWSHHHRLLYSRNWKLQKILHWSQLCGKYLSRKLSVMIMSSNGNIFRFTGPSRGEFTGKFSTQRPVVQSFDVFFDLCLNKRLSKQSSGWWFETPSCSSCSLWCHCNGTVLFRWQAFTWATDGQELQHHVATTDHTDLTHLPLDKMAAILANDNFKYIFLNENDRILIWISLKSVPKSPIDNKPALVQVMAWCWTGDKSLIEPMLTLFTDAYMRH